MNNISAVIIVKDGERTIGKCLASLANFSEVILYDTGSTDNTQQIATKFKNVKIITGEFIGFGPTKNKAIEYAGHEWIFSLDSDEVLSDKLNNAIAQQSLDSNCIYQIKRINFYKDQPVTYCWGADYLVRLFNRHKTKFNSNLVHEDIMQNNLSIKALSGAILHYPYPDISAFIQKADTYSTQFALAYQGKRSSSPLLAITNAIFSFCKTYFLKRGIFDGSAGLLISFSHAVTNFYKYMKLYELNK